RAEWKSEIRNPKSDVIFVLTRRADDLRARIAVRVDEMFRRGLVAETEQLLRRGLAENKTAMQAIGYRQVAEFLLGESRNARLAEIIEQIKIRTRQFTKRQLTWFRRHGNCEWIELQPDESPEKCARKIALLNPQLLPQNHSR
ncbi:MAG: hypothetical protein ACREFE_03740, partial [Limisphaerales bacterium]